MSSKAIMIKAKTTIAHIMAANVVPHVCTKGLHEILIHQDWGEDTPVPRVRKVKPMSKWTNHLVKSI